VGGLTHAYNKSNMADGGHFKINQVRGRAQHVAHAA